MSSKTKWVYGTSSGFGWGTTQYVVEPRTYEMLDFEPEFEYKSDVKRYWRNRKHILALKNMTLWKYTKTLVKGIVAYRKLMRY